VEDSRVRGGQTLGAIGSPGLAVNNNVNHEALPITPESGGAFGERTGKAVHPAEALSHTPITAPEGRVRGGNIVAMLANGMNLGKQSSYYSMEASTSTHNWL
jgi:hypothetical protein